MEVRVKDQNDKFFMKVLYSFKRDVQQNYALMIKSILLQSRQYLANVFQLATPVILMMFIFSMQLVVDLLLPTLPFFADSSNEAIIVKGNEFQLNEFLPLAVTMNLTSADEYEMFYSFKDEALQNSDDFIGSSFGLFQKYTKFETGNLINTHLYDMLENVSINSTNPFDVIGALKIQDYNLGKDGKKDFIVQFEHHEGESGFYAMGKYTSDICQAYKYFGVSGTMEDSQLPANLSSLINSLPNCQYLFGTGLMNLVNDHIIDNETSGYMSVETKVAHMDFKKEAGVVFSFDISASLGTFIYPLIILIVLPGILYAIVVEKESELKEIMYLMGLRKRNYVLSTFVFQFFIYCLVMAVFVILGFILGHRVFTQTNIFILLFTLFLSGIVIVSFSFLLSSFLSNSFTATIIGYLCVITTPIVGILLNNYLLKKGAYIYKFFLFFPLFSLTDIWYHLINDCNDLYCYQFSAIYENIDYIIAICFILFDSFFCFVLSLYLEEVLPKKFGVQKHPLYFLSWIFKLFKSKKDSKKGKDFVFDEFAEDDDVKEIRKKIQSGEINPKNQGIVVDGIVKRFGSNYAVKGVHFNVGKNEIFGLLGENGAGKSTLSNCLSLVLQVTNGNAYLDGHSIKNNGTKVRNSLGLCPQFSNHLWKDLTVKEHLEFYARLKGVSIFKEKEHVNNILNRIGLPEKEDFFLFKPFRMLFPKAKLTKQLSGGMKRRACIGIAMTGDPKCILLDEPTTGIDIKNRREIWSLIKSMKNKSIILTTHSMEEADALCENITIMVSGRMKCIGSSLHLKNKFGNGYIVTIKHDNNKEKVMELMTSFLEKFENLKFSVTRDFGNNLAFEINFSNDKKEPETTDETNENYSADEKEEENKADKVEQFDIVSPKIDKEDIEKEIEAENFHLEEPKEDEDVIIEIKQQRFNSYDTKLGEDVDGEFKISKIFELLESKKEEFKLIDFDVNHSTLEDVFLNVIRKDEEEKMKFLKAQKSKKNLHIKERKQLDTLSKGPKSETNEESKKERETIKSHSFIHEFLSIFKTNFFQILFLLGKNTILAIREWPISLIQILAPVLIVLITWILTLVTAIDSDDFYVNPVVSPLLSGTQNYRCKTWGGKECYDFVYSTNNNLFAAEVMDKIIDDFDYSKNQDYKEFAYTEDLKSFIYNNPNTTVIGISFSNVTEKIVPPFSTKNLTRYTLFFNSTNGDLSNQVMNWKLRIDNYILHNSLVKKGKITSDSKINFTITAATQTLPKTPSTRSVNGQSNFFSAMGAIMFSLSVMILFVISLFQLVNEKEKRLKTGLKLLGVKSFAYGSSWFITFVIFGFLNAVLVLGTGYACVLDVFIYSNPLFMFMLMFIFSLALISFAFAISTLFSKGKSALITGFIIVGVSFIANLFLANGTLLYLLIDLEKEKIWWFIPLLFQIFYPPFSFSKMFADVVYKTIKVYDSTTNTYEPNVGYTWGDFVSRNTGGANGSYDAPPSYISILYLLLNCLIYLAVYWYLDNLLPSLDKEMSSPFFFLYPSYWGIRFSNTQKFDQEYKKKTEEEQKGLEKDVLEEYKATRDSNNIQHLRYFNLKKTYRALFKPAVKAVKGVDFTGKEGKCTTVLGANGAGKSTAIDCLLGNIRITSGDITIHNFSVKNQTPLIRENLGVCMQDDLLWENLTAKEHVILYALFKGIPISKLKEEIRNRLESVDLYGVRNRCAGKFSGGMKRRLSVCLASVGDPRVMVADELTTGLDPFSRRGVWELIKKLKSQSTFLMTSHSMEEADALSDKIMIFDKGNINAVGDSLHLKEKYGDGYVLKFIGYANKKEEFEEFMKSAFPNASLSATNASNYLYNIGEKHKKELIEGIKKVEEVERVLFKTWSISHTTLEDVYMKCTSSLEPEEKQARI